MLAQQETLKPKAWGEYSLYSLTNRNGTQVDISDLGAIIVNFFTTDKHEQRRNIVLGYDTPEQYIEGRVFFGCVVGPWANRIANGCYEYQGQIVQLEKNDGDNHLHGASANIGAKRWAVEEALENKLVLSVAMKAEEAGYPANIQFKVVYELTDNDHLNIEYSAIPDATVPLNMTQHSYFNLGDADNVLDHIVQIHSDKYLHVDSKAIPREVRSIAATPLDLRAPVAIGQSIDSDFEQLTMQAVTTTAGVLMVPMQTNRLLKCLRHGPRLRLNPFGYSDQSVCSSTPVISSKTKSAITAKYSANERVSVSKPNATQTKST
ncbi:aldose 1-epimerase [Vibrio astriarenae]|nr:aldose 1-epimerase [Vibrio sp. C7]